MHHASRRPSDKTKLEKKAFDRKAFEQKPFVKNSFGQQSFGKTVRSKRERCKKEEMTLFIKGVVDLFLDILFPPVCPFCGQPWHRTLTGQISDLLDIFRDEQELGDSHRQ